MGYLAVYSNIKYQESDSTIDVYQEIQKQNSNSMQENNDSLQEKYETLHLFSSSTLFSFFTPLISGKCCTSRYSYPFNHWLLQVVFAQNTVGACKQATSKHCVGVTVQPLNPILCGCLQSKNKIICKWPSVFLPAIACHSFPHRMCVSYLGTEVVVAACQPRLELKQCLHTRYPGVGGPGPLLNEPAPA